MIPLYLHFLRPSSVTRPFNSYYSPTPERQFEGPETPVLSYSIITMPSFKSILSAAIVGFAAMGAALPAQPKLSETAVRHYDLARRQNAAAASAGITDIDILQL